MEAAEGARKAQEEMDFIEWDRKVFGEGRCRRVRFRLVAWLTA